MNPESNPALTDSKRASWLFGILTPVTVIGALFLSAILRDMRLSNGALDNWRTVFLATFEVHCQFVWCGALVIYFAFFAVANIKRFQPQQLKFSRLWHPEPREAIWISTLLLCCLALLVLVRFCLEYEKAASGTDVLVLLSGMLLHQGLLWSAGFVRSPVVNDQRKLLVGLFIFLGCLCLLLSPLNTRRMFFYHGQPRWLGIYANPNIFGMLMGVTFVLAVGRIWSFAKARRFGVSALHALPAAFSGLCVIKSYSREAWLSILVGFLFLTWSRMQGRIGKGHSATQSINNESHWARKALIWGLIGIVIGIGIACAISKASQSKSTLARRAFSAFNQVDFSSRNRLASYQDGINMLLDKPLTGYGWRNLIAMHNRLYLQPGLSDGQALKLNDFLMLALQFGIPALAILALFVRFWSLADFGMNKRRWYDDTVLCRAAALMLAIGFVFSDGLFRLAPGGSFWLFLTLGTNFEALVSPRSTTTDGPAGSVSIAPNK